MMVDGDDDDYDDTIVAEDNDRRYQSQPNKNLDQFCQSRHNYLRPSQEIGSSIGPGGTASKSLILGHSGQ